MARRKRKLEKGKEIVCPTSPCSQCTRNCLLFHGKNKDGLPVVGTFFKIMLAKKFREFMPLPHEFVPMVSDLIGQETQLEDANGKRWTVKLSNYKGLVAFQQGWHDFILGHDIKIGEFVTFHYVKQSHFIVEIYGRNGCQKLKCSVENGNQKKRMRTCRNSTAGGQVDGTHDLIHRHGSSMLNASPSNVDMSESLPLDGDNASNINVGCGKAQLVPSTNYDEELYYMIDRDVGDIQRDQWSCLYDLPNFEMQNTPPIAEINTEVVNEERLPCCIESMPKSQPEADIVNQIPMVKETVSLILHPDMSMKNFEIQNTPAIDEINKDVVNENRPSCCIESMPKFQPEADIVNKIVKEGVSSIPLPDVSMKNFEMLNTPANEINKEVVNDKRPSRCVESMPKSQPEVDIVNRIPMIKEAVSSVLLPDASKLVITEKSKDLQMTDGIKFVNEKYSGNGNSSVRDQRSKAHSSNDQDLISKEENTPHTRRRSSQRIQRKIADGSELHSMPISGQTQKFHDQAGRRKEVINRERLVNTEDAFGRRSRMHGKHPVMKECDKQSNQAIKDGSHVYKVVKMEPVDTSDLPMVPVDTGVEVEFSIPLVEDRKPYIELPDLVQVGSSWVMPKHEKNLVFLLQDPLSRQWPVLYELKFGANALTGGWETFCEANFIRPGDECVFTGERRGHTYRVDIIRKQD